MGTTHIEINHVSHPPSVTEDDDLQDTGVHVSPQLSPQYSERGGEGSQDGSSGLREEYVHLRYPHESHEIDLGPSDSASASRLDTQGPPGTNISRSSSSRRDIPPQPGVPLDPRLHRSLHSDDGDSTVEFIRGPHDGREMPRDRVYHGYNGAYTHSSSSGAGSYYPSGQMVHYAPQPQMPMPFPQQYSQIASPSTMYAPSHPGFAPYSAHPGSQMGMGSPYAAPSPYGMMPYGAPPPGYFPPQYPQQPQFQQQQYPPQYPHPQHMDQWRVNSPPSAAQAASPSPSVAQPAEPPKPPVDPDEIVKRMEAMLLAQSEKESAERMAREEAAAAAAAAAKAAADAKAEREASDKRIREEAHAQAMKAAEDARKAEEERALRDKQIREEAAAAALAAAAQEAEAKAAKAAADAKIADDAAAAARTEAEKKAAEEAAKLKEESEKKQAEAEAKLKEAEEAAAKATKEAEEAKKAAEAAAEAAAPPAEKKAPIRFHDAVGRKFNFPFELCSSWRGMEKLINQAFQHVEVIGPHVQDGHYDLVGPTGEIILPSLWDAIIEPDWQITMHMWPMPEPEKPPDDDPSAIVVPPMDAMEGMLNMDDILGTGGGKGKERSKGSNKRSRSKPGGLTAWMLGGSSGSRSKQSLKGDKKPEYVAVGYGSESGSIRSRGRSRRGSGSPRNDEGACVMM